MQPVSAKAPAKALSDLEIAQRIAAGDRGVLERLMRKNNQRLFRTARSILKDDAEAEDAVQEAYLLAYQAMAGFRGGASLSTWLVRIVVNEAIARARKRGRRAEVIHLEGTADADGDHRGEDNLPSSTEQPEQAVLRAETRRLIEAKIDQLPDVFRTVFVLRAVEELTVEEAAACLGIPPATVRTRYFRAKGLLREAIARDVDVSMEEAFAFAGDRCDRIVAGVLERLNHLPGPDSGPDASPT
jgi:RNA polymerase sigma-70 factor (ECF subfamily)